MSQLPDGLPPERGVGHTIPQLPGSKPVYGPLYRLSPAEKVEVERGQRYSVPWICRVGTARSGWRTSVRRPSGRT